MFDNGSLSGKCGKYNQNALGCVQCCTGPHCLKPRKMKCGLYVSHVFSIMQYIFSHVTWIIVHFAVLPETQSNTHKKTWQPAGTVMRVTDKDTAKNSKWHLFRSSSYSLFLQTLQGLGATSLPLAARTECLCAIYAIDQDMANTSTTVTSAVSLSS